MEYQHILKMFDLANLDLGIYVAASVVTIIALAISTRYALNNLLNSNSNGIEIRPKQVDLTAEKTSTPQACDGIDHGDKKENKDGEVKPDDSLPALSPRYPDPVDYCEHIQGEIKRVQQKVATKSIAETLTEDQLREEREIQRQQLADIFRLMQEQQDRFGIGTMDDMQEQMKLYAV